MNSILYFAKLDMLSFKPYRKYLIILPFPILAILQPPVLATAFLLFLILTSLSPYLFASEERNDMQRLYALLPISKKQVVLGRYVCGISAAITYILAMGIALLACSSFVGMTIPTIVFSLMICMGLFLIATACQYPIFFQLGFIKAKFFAALPSFILFGIIIICRQVMGIDFLSDLSALSIYSSTAILAIGIVAIIISATLSIAIYQSREA